MVLSLLNSLIFQRISSLEIAIAYRRYLFFILGRRPRSLSDSDKEAALYLAADKERDELAHHNITQRRREVCVMCT